MKNADTFLLQEIFQISQWSITAGHSSTLTNKYLLPFIENKSWYYSTFLLNQKPCSTLKTLCFKEHRTTNHVYAGVPVTLILSLKLATVF